MTSDLADFSAGVAARLRAIDGLAAAGGFDRAIDLMVAGLDAGGVLQAFGTGHSEGFAMELAGRAGGLIPSHAIKLGDLVLLGGRPVASLADPATERDPGVADALYGLYDIRPADVFLIASNSGVNGSVVGIALRAKAEGHPVIAVTSLDHTHKVQPKHPSGQRLCDIADVVFDNLAPYGDTTLPLAEGLAVGAVSSITAAYIAQLLTIGVARRFTARGDIPPLYISANTPGGDAHNLALEALYGSRIKAYAAAPPTRA
ncbi:MAG: SIS domain-containing protein [Propionibacteriaceae bacterium]|jgi:uncharacterized phosphosugar-binding protein|nr:SIS domain-containing protein [Propionibacteriaceae bacterium]